MGKLTRQLKTLSGAIVGFILIAIITFWVLNLVQTRGGPVAGVGGWLFRRASGEAYSGGSGPAAAAPMVTSPYSANNNLGPQI